MIHLLGIDETSLDILWPSKTLTRAYFAWNEMLSMIQMDYLRPLGVFHSDALFRRALVFHDAFGGSHLQV